MDAVVLAIQNRLTVAGFPVTCDGKWGPQTAAAFEAANLAPVPGVTGADFAAAAHRLAPDDDLARTVAKIRAVDEVESGGGWFKDVRADILDRDGPGGFLDSRMLPKILFEAHHFDRLTGGRFRASHPNLSSARWSRALYIGGQGEYIRLDQAMTLNRDAALASASWGRYQIMGFNHGLAGHRTLDAFVVAMKAAEALHLMAFAAFIENSGLTEAFRRIDGDPVNCRPFARGYNGAGYAANAYDVKIANAFLRWS